MDATLAQPGQLPKLAPSFTHTVLDTPPRYGAVQRAALMVADVALLPCGPGALDAWALAESVELVKEAQALRSELVAAVLLTRVQAGTALGRGARDVLAEAGLPVLRAELGLRVAYAEALAAGLGVGAYAPGSPAALEVAALVAELLALGAGRKGAKRRG
jgi:chromosome partitioning protein